MNKLLDLAIKRLTPKVRRPPAQPLRSPSRPPAATPPHPAPAPGVARQPAPAPAPAPPAAKEKRGGGGAVSAATPPAKAKSAPRLPPRELRGLAAAAAAGADAGRELRTRQARNSTAVIKCAAPTAPVLAAAAAPELPLPLAIHRHRHRRPACRARRRAAGTASRSASTRRPTYPSSPSATGWKSRAWTTSEASSTRAARSRRAAHVADRAPVLLAQDSAPARTGCPRLRAALGCCQALGRRAGGSRGPSLAGGCFPHRRTPRSGGSSSRCRARTTRRSRCAC